MLEKFVRKHWRPILIFLLLFMSYAYFDYNEPGWNVNSRLGLTRAIVEEGRLTIDSYHNALFTGTGDKAYYNGHYYCDKAIGASLLGAVVYAPFYFLNNLINHGELMNPMKIGYLVKIGAVSLPSALFAALLFVWILQKGISKRWAALITLFYGLGTMSFSFGTLFFGHQLGAIMAFGSFMLAEVITRNKENPPGKTLSFLLGFLAGFCLITEYTTGLLIIPIAVYYLSRLNWRSNDQKNLTLSIALPFIGGLIPLLILLAYNNACFGTPFTLAYKHMSSDLFQEGMGQGLMGITSPDLHVLWLITIHPFRGLFWISPWLLIGFAGWYIMYREKRWWWLGLSIWATVSFIILNASYYMWWGGWTYGPRHMIPAMVFMTLPAFLIKSKSLRTIIIFFGVVSVVHITLLNWADPQTHSLGVDFYDGLKAGWHGQQLPPESVIEEGKLSEEFYSGLYFSKEGLPIKSAPLFSWVPGKLKLPELIHNWGTSIGLKGIYSIFPLLLLIITCTIILVYPFKGRNKGISD